MDNEPPACIFKVNEMRDEMEFFGVALIVGVLIGVLIASQNRSSQKRAQKSTLLWGRMLQRIEEEQMKLIQRTSYIFQTPARGGKISRAS